MKIRWTALSVFAAALCAAPVSAATPIDPREADEQIQILTMALKDQPTSASTMMRLAQVLHAIGREGEAAQWESLALAIDAGVRQTPANQPTDGGCTPNTGPDIIVGDLNGIGVYTSTPVNGFHGFSIGTTSCNLGDQNVQWISNTNQHPVIGQNMYRISGAQGRTRIEQIGLSWLKHGFTALTQNLCCTCNGSGGSVLGVGCSDPYDAGLNGSQSNLGPRFEVNASTGVFAWPASMRTNTSSDPTYKHCRVAASDMNPASFTNPIWIAEGQYISSHDAQFKGLNTLYGQPVVGGPLANGLNNASYRRFTFNYNSTNGAVSGVAFSGSTVREKPAILAWKDFDPAVTIVNADVPDEGGPGLVGRFIVGYLVTNNGNGTWDYEYAIHNLNSHRSARTFTVPFRGDGVQITNIGFHDVSYHSGDGNGSTFTNQINFDGTDWTPVVTPNGSIGWSTQTIAQNINANALRWGTLYNFRFTANVAPVNANATIGLFRPGAQADPVAPITGPGCRWNGDYNNDGAVDFADINIVLGAFGSPYTFTELNIVLGNFGQTCN